MWSFLRKAAGFISGTLLSVMLSVSFRDASANGASYLTALGITGVPEFLQTTAAALVVAIVLTAILTFLITRWWLLRPKGSGSKETGPSGYDLAARMEALTHDMHHYLKYEGFNLRNEDPNAILMECASFNITLHKLGFAVPPPATGNAQTVFAPLIGYYTRLAPLLRDGHTDEARKVALHLAGGTAPA